MPTAVEVQAAVQSILAGIKARDPDQKEFQQAAEEVLDSLSPVLIENPQYLSILSRLVEPERQIVFRVPWVDDKGAVQCNRGFRVQFSSSIGPYKGGLRFHPSVTLSVIKFLGFEQTFKNALTTLPMGGGKGGSDFDPKGKSDGEVMRFCQSFMSELYRHVGAQTDVPAGDIGVGGREIGFMFGQYKRLSNEWVGILTGKGLSYGGSLIRPEATGYGAVYFGLEILKDQNQTYQGKKVLISGSGNVATYAAEKCMELGATVLTLSDSTGYLLEPNGFTTEQLAQVMHIKNELRTTLASYKSATGKYFAGEKPWGVAADIAIPSATQNEINVADAKTLAANGVKIILEGANMPCDNDAIAHFHSKDVILAAAKACNAGGVATSGLEMAQNATMSSWTREEVDEKLKTIMQNIYKASASASKKYNVPLQAGANIAGFIKVAEAMLAQGVV